MSARLSQKHAKIAWNHDGTVLERRVATVRLDSWRPGALWTWNDSAGKTAYYLPTFYAPSPQTGANVPLTDQGLAMLLGII
jgi:hypothetical protein